MMLSTTSLKKQIPSSNTDLSKSEALCLELA